MKYIHTYICICLEQKVFQIHNDVSIFKFIFIFSFSFSFDLFMILGERERERERGREAETQAEGEAGSMHREPDVGFDPGSPGSRPGPKAGAKPLRHPGIPLCAFFKML